MADGIPHASTILFLADTDRTQAYVFETSRLPEIRGASRVLDDANRQAGEQVAAAGGEVLVSTGGMLIALLPADQNARRLGEQIQRLYADLSHGSATVTVAWRPLPPGWKQRPFGDILTWASRWLDREKRGRTHAPWVSAPPHAERCRSCGLRPASPEASYADWPLCPTCRHKITYQGRLGWFQTFARWLQTQGEPHAERWRPLLQAPTHGPRPIPQDIHELAQVSARRDTFALIYLDGDGLGQVFRRCQTPEEVRHLSRRLEAALREAVFQALAVHLAPATVQPGESRRMLDAPLTEGAATDGEVLIYPFEILTIGGDDVWLVTPTHLALDIALHIMGRFQAATGAWLPEAASLSGGVVFAEEHVPIPMLLDIAKTLAASAKAARRKARAREGYLDFWVVGTDLPDRDIRHLRRLFPYRLTGDPSRPDDAVVRFSGRPYPYSVWQQGLPALRTLSLPPSQLQRLAALLPQGVEPLRAYYHYQRARQRSREEERGWKALDEALGAFGGGSEPADTLAYPWFAYQKHAAGQPWTPLVDVLELAPFVSSPTQGSDA